MAFSGLAPGPAFADPDAIVLEAPQIEVDLQGRDPANLEIKIGDALGTDFVSFEGGRALVAVPFPDSPEPFTVSFVDRQSGEAVFEQSYRMTPYQPFDRMEVDGYAQFDPYGTMFARVDPDRPKDKFQSFRGDWDGVAGASWEIEVDEWSFAARAEGVMTSRDFKQFRRDGGRADLSDLLGSLDYKGDTISAHVEFGDARFEGNSPLVNEGFSTRGFSMQVGLFDERVKIHAGYGFGTDIAGAQHLNPYSEKNSRRLAGGIDLMVWDDEYVQLSTRGTYYSAARPETLGFGIGATEVGEHNQVLGAGLTLGLFDERVVFTSDFAWSEYSNPADENFGVTEFTTFDIIEVGNENDHAEQHRVDVKAWDGDELQIDLFGTFGETGPFYRALETYVPPDRRTYGFGGTLDFAPFRIDIEHEKFFTNIEEFDGVLSTREVSQRGRFEVDLEDYRDGFDDENDAVCSYCQAIPSNISFEIEHWQVKGTNGRELINTPGLFFGASRIVNESTETYTLAMDWDFGDISADLELFRGYDNDHSIANGDADSRETSIEIGGRYRGEVVSGSLGLFGAVTDHLQTTDESTDLELGADADISLSLEDLPDVTARGDINWYRTKADADSDDSRELSYAAQASLDFSKFLPDVAPWIDSYLTTTFLFEHEISKSAFFGTHHNIDMSWTVNFGVEY